MIKVRTDEPEYARLESAPAADKNVYGNDIDLIAASTVPAGESLYINADSGVGDSANRNKQHGFHFTADNCIGCHACEAACSEKNDLPPHISFRSVGYVEGGTYPNLVRMNLSMACNHCDDPVCLRGCPTNAYTKHAAYGAVLQDPDTCFGCGYCTWVCPYNAPQLDPVEGHVQKCNMCVDRLEVGLKPACVSACVGNALDFGVIENIPENRQQVQTSIPGFPDPEISRPNIRFQQTRSMPREFTRPDSAPIKYHRNDETGTYVSVADLKSSKVRGQSEWNLAELSSKENPLVFFTLVSQAVIGAFAIAFIGAYLGMESLDTIIHSKIATPFVMCLAFLQALVLFVSAQHLGKPLRFYRGFNNLRFSPLSREAFALSVFFGFLAAVALLLLLNYGFFGFIDEGAGVLLLPLLSWELVDSGIQIIAILATLCGVIGVYYMHMIYRIKARPFWNHWQVLTSFFGSMLSVGAILIGLLCLPLALLTNVNVSMLAVELIPFVIVGLGAELAGHIFHARDLQRGGGEGAASLHILKTKFGKTYQTRNVLLCVWLAISIFSLFYSELLMTHGRQLLPVLVLVATGILVTAGVSRALFYVIVIPTTMPGGLFWKNKGFEQHARESGLAKMPQVGVVEFGH
ncbi:MAG: dimethyl sulfoxide reductase anchor subunit [Gammaproteobacteria bacterium]|nr:dimethyl sulfoxide reductase anchor subunit [Gammaproteobacteria bacterium]